jgi:hypothetical protein
MIPRKATIVLFLVLSIIVAFYNCLIGRFQYLTFIVPFSLAFLIKGRAAYIIEVFGIAIAATYVMLFQVLPIGILGMIVSAVMFFTLAPTLRLRRVFLYFTTAIVFCAAYFNLSFVSNNLVSAGLAAMLDARNDKPLADKCIETLEKSATIAQDALNIAKRGASHGRRQ